MLLNMPGRFLTKLNQILIIFILEIYETGPLDQYTGKIFFNL